MAKTKINRAGWGAASNVFYVGAMRTTDNRCAAVETENAAWLQSAAEFHTAFQAVDDAYLRTQLRRRVLNAGSDYSPLQS